MQREEVGCSCGVYRVPDCARNLPKVRVEVPIGGLHVQCIKLQIGGRGVCCAADERELGEGGGCGPERRRGAGEE